MSGVKYFHGKECGGIQGWNWIDTDSGAWDGPKHDWESSHYPNIQKYVSNFETVVQAGGNQGMYPRLLSRLFKKVYTFEPDPLNFKTLVTNCDQDNIVKMQAALGASDGFCEIHRRTMHNTGMHQVKSNPTEMIPLLALDMVFPIGFKVDLIMLDLEEYELYALYGMREILKKNKPVLFVERPTDSVFHFLTRLGYKSATTSAMDTIFVDS